MHESVAKSDKRWRIALLGAGVISQGHWKFLKQAPWAEMVAVCDLDAGKAEALRAAAGVPVAFQSLEQMLEKAKPDVVHVLLPPSRHAEAAKHCLEAGAHVFVEKPLATSGADCRMLEETARRTGRVVGVNHNLASMPVITQAIETIRERRLGALEHVTMVYNLPVPFRSGARSHWMFGGTPNLMLELGPHPVSVICRLLGAVREARTVVAGETRLPNGVTFYPTWVSALVCERGTATCRLSIDTGHLNTWMHAAGEDGEIWADLRRNTFRVSEKYPVPASANLRDAFRNSFGVAAQAARDFWAVKRGQFRLGPEFCLQTQSFTRSLGDFYDALRAGRTPRQDGASGTMVVEACERIVTGIRVAEAEEAPHHARR